MEKGESKGGRALIGVGEEAIVLKVVDGHVVVLALLVEGDNEDDGDDEGNTGDATDDDVEDRAVAASLGRGNDGNIEELRGG